MAEIAEPGYTTTDYSEREPTPDEAEQLHEFFKNIDKEKYCKAIESMYPQVFGWPRY